MGESCHQPTRRAIEQNAAAMLEWTRQGWPRLKKPGEKTAPLSWPARAASGGGGRGGEPYGCGRGLPAVARRRARWPVNGKELADRGIVVRQFSCRFKVVAPAECGPPGRLWGLFRRIPDESLMVWEGPRSDAANRSRRSSTHAATGPGSSGCRLKRRHLVCGLLLLALWRA